MIKVIAMLTVAVCLSFYAMCIMAGRDDERSGWK